MIMSELTIIHVEKMRGHRKVWRGLHFLELYTW